MKYKIVQADENWFRENINCQYACPVNTPASQYIERIQEENYDGALGLNYMANIFPHILSTDSGRSEWSCKSGWCSMRFYHELNNGSE